MGTVNWVQLICTLVGMGIPTCLALLTIILAFNGRLAKVESQVEDAKLPEMRDALSEIKTDIRWIRETMEHKREGK